jgi:hypothetical protein
MTREGLDMGASRQDDLLRLQDEEVWDYGPTWDLEFHVPVAQATSAVTGLLQCRQLRGWWQPDSADSAEAIVCEEYIRASLESEDGWLPGVRGFACVDGERELPCKVGAWIPQASGADPRSDSRTGPSIQPAYGLVLLYLPAGGISRFFPEFETSCFAMFRAPESWDVPWVNQLSAFFKSVATEFLAACDAKLAFFGMEGADFEAATITADDLYNPYAGVYLPVGHPLSTTRGGIDVPVGAGYRLWGLGVESPQRPERS